MEIKNYYEVRDLIQDGDIISFLRPIKKISLLSKVITYWTKSPIYHTGIAVWLNTTHGDRRLFVVEAMDKTRRLTPLSTYVYHPIHVLAKPDYVDFNKFAEPLIERVSEAEYSYLKAIQSGVRQYLKLPYVSISTGEFCSELAAKCWKIGGLQIDDTCLNPAILEDTLINQYNITYRCWTHL